MLFLDENKRQLKKLEKKANAILALEEKYKAMSDDELKYQTVVLKERLEHGKTLDDILIDAFATSREAARRVLGLLAYKEQMMAGIAAINGDVAEQKTGEGKTLTSIAPVYLAALEGKGVHVVTVNEYLSERDKELMGKVHEFLGLTVGLNLREKNADEKRAAYNCDITYTTNSELGFDYLRDNMVISKEQRVIQRGLNFALVDEADSILIDESRTPLIISGGKKTVPSDYLRVDMFVKGLKNSEYDVDIKDRIVNLTENGIDKAERFFGIKNLYRSENNDLVHRIKQSLYANIIMKKDVEYIVDYESDEVLIVDSNTGRVMKGREFSEGLHQAIQAKEGVTIKDETMTIATITYQNFFRLYNKLAGMTGTAKTEEEEFLEIYNMRVIVIPTHRPVQRIDANDYIFATKKAKNAAIVKEVAERYKTGQPVLIGTADVETSEILSKILLKAGIPHQVLNAKNHAMEADIIANAGQKGAVTIATNMAGRGTDIKLGDGVKELGGLCVLGSERHESRRVDNQLRGRSGRQGDPGFSRFYVSLEDNLMVRFGTDGLKKYFTDNAEDPTESPMLTKAITNAQIRVEGINFDSRKSLLDYDDVMRQQREIIYKQRNAVLDGLNIHTAIETLFTKVFDNMVAENTDENDNVNFNKLEKELSEIGLPVIIQEETRKHKKTSPEKLSKMLKDVAWKQYESKVDGVEERVAGVERTVLLRCIDSEWPTQIDTMDKLRKGINLRSYAQNNPLQAYMEEGFELFDSMMNVIAKNMVSFCIRFEVVVRDEEN